jgi:hypothetical protein
MWDDVHGYLDTVKRAYRRDNWQTQPNYCEVWSEKTTVLPGTIPVRSAGTRKDPFARAIAMSDRCSEMANGGFR